MPIILPSVFDSAGVAVFWGTLSPLVATLTESPEPGEIFAPVAVTVAVVIPSVVEAVAVLIVSVSVALLVANEKDPVKIVARFIA